MYFVSSTHMHLLLLAQTCSSTKRSQEWNRIGKPDGSFFKWLSTPDVQLEGCPRHELENDVVHYCQPNERENYALRLDVTDEVRRWAGHDWGRGVGSGGGAIAFTVFIRQVFS